MRVRYGELDAAERRARDDLRRSAQVAWRRLAEGDAEGACQLMNAIDPRIELTLSTEQGVDVAAVSPLETSAWPLAELLLAQAPADIDWTLALGRSALPVSRALADVKRSHDLDLERAGLRAGFGRGHLLDITLAVPGGVGSENEQNGAENLVRAVVGDRVFETWVGAVHAVPAPRFPSLRVLDVRAPRTTLQVQELFDTVAAATRGVLQGLPEQARAHGADSSGAGRAEPDSNRAAVHEEWTLLEVEPLSEERAQRKDDLLLASTCTPELLRCYLDGSPCSSRRFSRVGEQFVYVSYPDLERTMARRVARRTVIEMALSECVRNIGAVTGVGLGVKTSYIDVALCNLETGLARLVAKLRELELPPATFIQFFDSELAEEWLAIWPDSRLPDA